MKQKHKHKRRLFKKKKSHAKQKLGCLILGIMLIPIVYGFYLYYLQTQAVAPKNLPPTEMSRSIHVDKELEIPLSLIPRQEQLIHHIGYTVSYNKDWKIPNWVSYELTRQETRGIEKRKDRFLVDPHVEGLSATNSDYSKSGYDKGHMAPAADMKWSSTAMKESFYFTNICPQHPQLNRRAWKELEEKIRDWATADSAIIVICGPVIRKQNQTIGKNQVSVPRQYFKIILSPFVQPIRAIGFLFPNAQATAPLPEYVVTVDSIESLTDLDFFAPLPDDIENLIESHSDYQKWPQ